jgi:hypothetical protein
MLSILTMYFDGSKRIQGARAGWWCGVDVGVLYMTAQLGTLREGYDEHNSKSSLSCETKVYRTSRSKNETSEG